MNPEKHPSNYLTRALRWLAQPQHFALVLLALQPLIWLVFFVERYASPFPIWEEWTVKGLPAYLIKTGGFTFDELIRQHFEHRLLLTRLLTVVNTALFNWNLKLEIYANLLLAGGVLLLCLYCLHRDHPRLLRYGLVVLPFLLFTSRALSVWLWGMYSQHLFANLLVVAVITWVWVRPANGHTLLFAAVLIILAQFTNGNGMLAWGLILLLMPVVGYRQWWSYVVWIITAITSVLVYFIGFESRLAPQITLETLLAALAFLGAVFTRHPEPLLVIVGAGGILFASINAAYLYWGKVRTLYQMMPWLLFCLFGLGTAALLASGRATSLTGYDLYVASMTGFWLGFTGLTLTTLDDLWQRRRTGWQHGLYATNLIVVGLLVSLYSVVAVGTEKEARVTAVEEQCAIAFPLTRDVGCTLPNLQHGIQEFVAGSIDYLAAADLLVFPQVTVLATETTQADNPLLLLDMPLGWQHIYTIGHLGGQFNSMTSFHLIEPDDPPTAKRATYNNSWQSIRNDPNILMAAPLPQQLLDERLPYFVRGTSAGDLNLFETRLAEHDAVWWVRVQSDFGDGSFPIERTSYGNTYLEVLLAQGFLPFDVPNFDSDTAAALDVAYYRRPPLVPPVRYHFGTAPYRLNSWDLSSYTPTCDTPLTIETWWSVGDQAEAAPQILRLILVDGTGTVITEVEQILATSESLRDWGERTHVITSQLVIGCNVPAGSYDVIASLLDPVDGTSQPIRDASGSAIGTAYLTTVTLE